MKLQRYIFRFLLLGSLILSQNLIAQKDTIVAETWVIETLDGNEFTGEILSEDQEALMLHTNTYGDIRYPSTRSDRKSFCNPKIL